MKIWINGKELEVEEDINEVKTLMDLCKEELKKAFNDSRIHKNKVRISKRILANLKSLL